MNRTLAYLSVGFGVVGIVAAIVTILTAQQIKATAPIDCSIQGNRCIKIWVDASNATPPVYTVFVDAPTVQNKAGRQQTIYWFIERNQNQGFFFPPAAGGTPTGIQFVVTTEFSCKQFGPYVIECDDPTANAVASPGFKYYVNLTDGNSSIQSSDPYVLNY